MPLSKSSQLESTCLGVSFYRSRHARIRALKRQHSPSTYGYRVWGSCWLLMDYLRTMGLSRGLKVMEVGCGWGLAGIFCARTLDAEVTCVDADPEVFHYLRLHEELNQVKVTTMHKHFESLSSAEFKHIDLLIGTDICFWDELSDVLQPMINRALSSGVQRVVLADPGRSSFEKLATCCQLDHSAKVFTMSVRRPHDITGRILTITNNSVHREKACSLGRESNGLPW